MGQLFASGEALATEAFRYYYPIVRNLGQVERFVTTGLGSNPPAHFNAFSHARQLAGPADTFVAINNDTLYSIAQLDLSAGPLLLDVPPIGDRYLVLQFVDAWTNNFAYLGTRSTGTDAVRAVILPPGDEEPPPGAPADAVVIRVSTAICTIVGRFACDGPADVPAVHELQDALVLSPLREAFAPPVGIALPEEVDAELTFWEQARCWSLAYPPAAHDVAYTKRFADLGLLDVDSPFPRLDAPTRRFLVAGAEAGRFALETETQDAASGDGWTSAVHAFDFNVDVFGPGTIDAPEWRIDDPDARFASRAATARSALWGNHGYEAVYAQAFTDAAGDALDGRARYAVRFASPPPVGAFWSLTIYDLPEYYLVANPIGRYSIGDRTPGLIHDPDGALTVTISHDPPMDAVARANWLPAPGAGFRLILRMYLPGPEILDGRYTLPPISRASRIWR